MKTLYRINQVTLIITIVLYITIVYGMLAQIVLGGIQILSALLLLHYRNTFTPKIKKQLIWYWIIAFIYGLLWLIDWKFINETLVLIIGVMIIPMLIAGYFFYILNTLYTKNHEN